MKGKGYVYTKPYINLSNLITLKEIGIDNIVPIEDLHVTLMYDKTNPDIEIPNQLQSLKMEAFFQSIECIGNDNAIVIKFFSPELQALHYYLRSIGYKHSYTEFLPHMTIKYNSSIEELNIIRNYESKIRTTLGLTTIFYGVYSEEIND